MFGMLVKLLEWICLVLIIVIGVGFFIWVCGMCELVICIVFSCCIEEEVGVWVVVEVVMFINVSWIDYVIVCLCMRNFWKRSWFVEEGFCFLFRFLEWVCVFNVFFMFLIIGFLFGKE